jgi:hypothetical protein
MWSSPRTLDSQWQDSTGTTPVAVPGTVADTSNPVGLALDIRAGAPDVLGPELVVNGDFSDGTTDWTTGGGATLVTDTSIFLDGGGKLTSNGVGSTANIIVAGLTAGKLYLVTVQVYLPATNATDHCATLSVGGAHDSGARNVPDASVQDLTYFFTATATTQLLAVTMVNPGVAWSTPGDVVYIDNLTCKEVPGNHMLQSTSAARPLASAYDGQTLGPGDTYSSTGYPIFKLYDGVDDGMATAAFTAGTLTSAMDCMIVLRRDGSAETIVGLANELTDSNKYFGACLASGGESAKNCGSPTVWVSGIQVAGGTNVQRDVLNAALTANEFHILEYRNLDLSTWTQLFFGRAYTGYYFTGARGDILLYPSSASTEDKDAARQYLATYYGVTLP